VTRHGRVLPTPDDPRIGGLIEDWDDFKEAHVTKWPRSAWLGEMERLLRQAYPMSSARDLNLTARSLAPFYLADKDWQ
jgi:hypothetical protein